ncbi:MAG: AAA family ATPase [Anderseniella sp.]|nr:AAA family ATPase [Anderseniella sp.]
MTQTEPQAPATDSGTPVVAAVPRINITVFCSTQATIAAMQQVVVDRRMARAHVDVRNGGIMAAAQAFSQATTPDVLVMETEGHRDQVLSELSQLAQVCDPSTKVILIGHVNDVILYRELIRQGLSEYLVAPVHQLQVIDAISSLFNEPGADPIGRIVAFIGAKGGVGSSTIAHNVAALASGQYQIDTIVTDLDLAFGTAGLNFNQDPAHGIAEAIASSDRIDQTMLERLLTKCSDRLNLLSAPAQVEKSLGIEDDTLEPIIDAIRSSAPLVILDIPNLWTVWSKQLLMGADDVIITSTPDLASLRNTKNIFDFLTAARPNDKAPLIVLNQVGVHKRPEIPVGEFSKAIGVEPTVVIPFDAHVFGTASTNGQMVGEVGPKSKAAEQVAMLGQLLIGKNPEAPSGKSGSALAKLLPMLRKK